MGKKKISISDMIDRFGKDRIVKALTKRRFTNKKRTEMRKTGQKHMGFMGGGVAGLFGKRKNVEAGEPEKKKKKNIIKENTTKKQKRLDELRKELGMAMGGIRNLPGRRRKKPRKPIFPDPKTDPTRPPKPKLPGPKAPKKPGMKKGGKITQKDIDKTEEGVMIVLEKKAAGGITGKTTFGELSKRKPLKKGIRLKGKGSSFMKEYKKRVYNRAGGGSVNGGARGTGIAVKGTNFKGVF